ncbi:phosphotransferase [Longivirga aurantiaca]|uniref:Phosphotransferase n=1 Tax=Longivirga aurantiaca TaxID=1837743 RepID=A0ABW1T0U8_9ACTN
MVPDPRGVLEAFALPGEPTAYVEVAGGWSNLVLRLTTTHGDYAVKELRNAWGEPRWLDWLAEGWRLETACAAAGVPVPEPVPAPDGGCLAWVPSTDGGADVPVRVHRWAEASTVPREPVGAPLAEWLGRTLAAVHRLALTPLRPDLYAGRVGLTTAGVWPDLVGRATSAGVPWASDLADAEPVARAASALLAEGDRDGEVLCHGDVDQKNLLLGAGGPLLIDWDVVLPTVPAHDLAHAALTMAAWSSPEVAGAVVRAYRASGGDPAPVEPQHLGPALASRLGWIRFTVDRALDAGASVQDRAAGDAVPGLLADLRHRVATAERITTWLS